ncbi:DUF1772 domain-containing protein [Actinokineospora fastidiosa]|uniref:DUF1772 domain-containing protein n=1 Tax=Actinokineospora fastidiosa TaxID=1816 RepID=A0A918GGM1_9PSEU|nr:anthrone oxygenase family protein [Actinokineospora fastidiosa]GGS34156.1 hypothetical protein GCM10010171_30670 [Actinokineospora fastidiosa]
MPAVVAAAFTWIAMLSFGGILVETIVIYPNVFHDPPASLASAVDFFTVTGPADLFPPLGAATGIAALAALALAWRTRARLWFAAALLCLVVGEFLFSMLFFWPRNDIMFEEGLAVHTAEVLRRTAVEFETGHWVRLAMSAVTATLGFVGLLRLWRAPAAAASGHPGTAS